MKYMFLLIVTFKIIKKKLSKLQGAMGFQTPNSSKPKLQPVTKPILSYDSWMARHPSALRSFDRLMKAASGKDMVVFLDYDGTLSPIVNDPDCAFMSEEMRAAVCEVAKNFPTAIISGRSRDKVKGFVKLNNVYYAGSHGMDIMAPSMPARSSDGDHYNMALDTTKDNGVPFQPAKKFLPAIREILKVLENEIKGIQGARIEDNGFCISVHFRQVQEKVLEIRPSIEWNKGHALEYFLDTLGLSSSSNILPVYIGDDRTDEDAFKVIQERGQGYPIIVSSIPKDTRALYSLRDPSEVLIFLSRLAKWRKTIIGSN
ncbi:probable trehalose-phosphate phosphatase 1 isoform X2 [Prosopis cineraria]|uniref:probable trehalose-phosphate phosphatase 1 isoform X2 n=1 Tax=Prosopis cineraria TaxID=364024 RepID=UPI00240EC4B5|nr:probable trehalose-phosphate phosphatase 1 isoform X2 [Prosopis cineraria]